MAAVTATATRPTAEDRIRAALWFAEHGFGVFSVWSATADGVCRCPKGRACDNAGKHPITANGFHDATTDPDRIHVLLSAGSQPNYGLVCPEGVFALDVDGEGITHLVELEQLHGPLPPTLRTQTANGEHVFLRWPAQLPRPIGHLFGFVTRWGSGRDAGYVIGPRSVHASGAVYSPSGTAEIAEMPEPWARAAVEGRPGAGTIVVGGLGYQLPERVGPQESRYEAIRTYVAHLYNRGFTNAEMWLQVRDQLAPRFDQALSELEIKARFDRTTASLGPRLGDRRSMPPEPVDPSTFPAPEDRGGAHLSPLGDTEYVEDLVRPGRIVVWAAEEGSGKSYAVAGELAIRVAAAGGSFAQSFEVKQRGPVLVLSEMHPDDDYNREDIVLASLELTRRDLAGRYYRLDLMTAAGGRPALTVPEWRIWAIDWLRAREAILLVVDTATGATQVDPWGREIQAVYANLRMMLSEYAQLAVVLIVHVRKPQGAGGERRLSDVLGEWGRWCDVVVLQENDGKSLERAKITTRKRVRHQRRILVTKIGGLLKDPVDLSASPGSRVPIDDTIAAIREHPGATFQELAAILEVSKATAGRYVAALGDQVKTAPTGPRRALRVWLDLDAPHQSASKGGDAVVEHENEAHQSASRIDAANDEERPPHASERVTDGVMRSRNGVSIAASTTASIEASDEAVVDASEIDTLGDLIASPTVEAIPTEHVDCADYRAHQTEHVRTAHGWACPVCHPEEIA